MQAIVAVAAVLTLAPFVPWGQFLSGSVSHSGALSKQKVVIDNKPKYGAAAGAWVNVNDLQKFPPNTSWVVTYPTSGDLTQDTQNPDTYAKFELIRLPATMDVTGPNGKQQTIHMGDQKNASAFVAFSKVCVHLGCSPNYIPSAQFYECPCHGSTYRLPDGLAVAGPAASQTPPSDAIPMLTLRADSGGKLWAEVNGGAWTDPSFNGVIGVGRFAGSYCTNLAPDSPFAKAGGCASDPTG
jgi:Rieske Fe-S protein